MNQLKSNNQTTKIRGLCLGIITLLATLNTSLFLYQNVKAEEPSSINSIPNTLESQPYLNTSHGFKINAPKGWITEESSKLGAIVLLSNPKTSQENGKPFSANINITIEPAQGYDLDSYTVISKDLLSTSLNNYKLMDQRKITVNGTQAYIISGTFIFNAYHLRNLQLIVVKNNKAFIVTGTMLESTWNEYKDLIGSSLMTFTLSEK